MTANTLVYMGHYETSFRRLHADQDHYWTKHETVEDHAGKQVDPIPEKFQRGIHFGFMQTTTGFIFVRINRLVLPTPVLFIGERHGPAAPGPSWSEITPEVALNRAAVTPPPVRRRPHRRSDIVADTIVANPGFRDELIRLVAPPGPRQLS